MKVAGAEVPNGVVSRMSSAPIEADGDTAKVAVADVVLRTARSLTSIPGIPSTVVPPGTKYCPVNFTLTLAPRAAITGSIFVISGMARTTVKITGDVVPPGVVSVISRAPSSALATTVISAVAEAELVALTPVNVTPDPVIAGEGL